MIGIDEINTITRPQTNAKGQTFDIVVTCINFEHLLGDKMRLSQVLINLQGSRQSIQRISAGRF